MESYWVPKKIYHQTQVSALVYNVAYMDFNFRIHKDLLTASLLFRHNPKDNGRFTELRNKMWNKHREAYEVQNNTDYRFIFADNYRKKLENILEKTEALLTDTEKSSEYQGFYQETLEYKDWLENEWKTKKDEVEKHLKNIIKTDLLPKDFEVLVIHPAVGGGSYLGEGKILWGHSEDWSNYSLVYLIHEALHEYFEQSDLTHALIELIADNELRLRLNKKGEYLLCGGKSVGHEYLRKLEEKILPSWREYVKQGADLGNIFDLIDKLKNSKVVLMYHDDPIMSDNDYKNKKIVIKLI